MSPPLRSFLPPGCSARVFSFGAVDDSPRPGAHAHPELELNLVRRGRARYLVAGDQMRLGPGDMLWLPAATPHVLLSSSPRFRMWVVWSRRGPARPGPGPLRGLDPADAANLAALCAVAAGQEGDPVCFEATLAAILAEAGHAWRRAGTAPSVESVHPAVAAAAHTLRQRGGCLGLDELAAAVHLSRSRLSRLFGAQTGITLVAFRNRCRIERFARLRAERPRDTLLALALDSGFGSYMQFYRVHKRLVGRPPSEGG